MIRFVSGSLSAVGESEVIIESHGIGYAVCVPVSLIDALPRIGESVKLYTYLSVREDAMQLFGFLSYDDYLMFKMLITVNGIGPKAALAILGTLSSGQFRQAVMAEDAKLIAAAPGIGPKTAKKIILELKDKLKQAGMFLDVQNTGTEEDSFAEVIQDAIEALVVLGYPRTEAADAVHAVEFSSGMTVEEVLKQSLKHMM